VDFVKDHRVNAVEAGVCQESPEEDARGDEFHYSPGTRPRLATDGVAYPVSERTSVQRGKATGGGAGSNATGLGHHHPRSCSAPPRCDVGHQRRHKSCLAGSRGCLHDGRAAVVPAFQSVGQFAQGTGEDQAVSDGIQ
jgi:hypothetical protein